ncbi:DNA polymerase III subunit gamma/tau [Tatumella sp. UCD-D_suzukii]|uniref:DNA polymerase III subunit gamma/tau n=1 Tax=Tatumella sp. UCD-D_suzukii TaxID=1408192 RepID=UPI000471DE28|nr:DNA polymerase III subunit gamma/tau [Tatumella sp. UCD-D_suzukii]
MSYQVLARKWRPQVFADVVGQQHVLTALANGLSLGRLHHAYLFSGTRGVGKTTIARLLAKGLNCELGVTATPCGQCENCREIEQGRFVDLIEIDAASRTKVEDTRDLLDNVQYAPARGRFKVYLIDEVHMLSRHSFNALLKTLEEPPEHVKFLLATTDPQKLPVTILSRCLQFHLKALDVPQISQQLTHILGEEQVAAEPRALQLLARAAEGSLRDALSLTDQAIAMGQGSVTADTVSAMLGTLDNDQPLALIEALTTGEGGSVMSLLQQAASRGVEWEALLVEMLRLLHCIAMLQLLPSTLDEEFLAHEQQLRELARKLPPEEIQLYYQTLLVGRKELAYAPDQRMGVEMTLLRALAFHPLAEIKEPATVSHTQPPAEPVAPPQGASAPATATTPAVSRARGAPQPADNTAVSGSTSQLLQARTELLRRGASASKKTEPAVPTAQPAQSALERLASVTDKVVRKTPKESGSDAGNTARQERYRWKTRQPETTEAEPVATPKALRTALEYEKTPELAARIAEEAKLRDPWAGEIAQLNLPKLVQQLALNAWKQQQGTRVHLHLRSAQKHLNSASARQVLTEVLSATAGETVELTIEADDNPAVRTPLEWRQAIYEEKLEQARQSIVDDPHIRAVQKLFDASLDEESIRPV